MIECLTYMIGLMPPLERYGLHIAGSARAAASGGHFASVNPATGEPWAEFADGGGPDVEQAVGAAAEAFRSPAWGGLSPTRRGRLLMRFGDLIAKHAEELAATETRQTPMPRSSGA